MQKKGISLIVLVITIIVMIILAATIIISINNANVMEKANEAVKKTDFATVTEMANVAWGEAYASGKRTQTDLENAVIDNLTANGVDLENKYTVTVTTKGVTVKLKGTYTWTQSKTEVTSEAGTFEVGKKLTNTEGLPTGYDWYILGAEDGKLLITTNVNIASNYTINGNSYTFTPKADGDYTVDDGTWGWLDAIEALNNLFKTKTGDYYINISGTKAEDIRSINVEDINRVTGYSPTTYSGYGVEITPDADYFDFDYPVEMPNGGKMKPNYYYYYPTTLTRTNNVKATNGIANTSAAYNVLFNANYWLASSYVYASSVDATFGLRLVDGGRVSGNDLWYSYGGFDSPSYGVRPAVTLKSDFLPEV